MPTARELLEQADALMRRNRAGDADIPVLTDVVADEDEPALSGVPARERATTGRDASRENAPRDENVQQASEAPGPERRAADAAAGPPTLTEPVEELAIDIPPLPEPAEHDSLPWLGPDSVDPSLHSITGPSPDSVGLVPPVKILDPKSSAEAADSFDEPAELTFTPTMRAAGSEPTPAPEGSMPWVLLDAGADEPARPALSENDERWRALAEQISMQVLQRIDLFTDTGLKSQLAAHLQPIVDRAGAELVQAINDHVGKLIRSYVAEAIEREIAQWREDNP